MEHVDQLISEYAFMKQLLHETIMVINEQLSHPNCSPEKKREYERMKAEVEEIIREMTLDYAQELGLLPE